MTLKWKIFSTVLTFILFTLLIFACSEKSITQSDIDPAYTTMKKEKNFRTNDLVMTFEDNSTYPQYGSGIAYYWRNKKTYRGTGFALQNGSSFDLQNGALSPPSDWPSEKDITLTMTVEKDPINNQLTFTFGPSGCSFDPPVEVWFGWEDIGTPVPTLFYVDQDDKLIEELPDNIDVYAKKMCLFINHFSRYSVAYSD